MAKKKTTKKSQDKNDSVSFDKVLPQNIVLIGEHVEEDKNIYISQSVYKEIHKFTKDKTVNESGGVLLGNVIEEFGKTNIIIRGFIEAKYCEGTPTTLKFTHETWEYIHKEADKRFPDYKILGWIHTHPNFGIFLSEYDKFIQENFFSDENQIAYVVDPIQNIEGFYFWINGKIERCKGFFVFDKTGVQITVSEGDKEKDDEVKAAGSSLASNIFTGVLTVAVIILMLVCINLNGKINNLQKQQEALVDSANQSLNVMSQQISALSRELSAFKTSVNESLDELMPKDDESEDGSDETGSEEGDPLEGNTADDEDNGTDTDENASDETDAATDTAEADTTGEDTTGGEESENGDE